MRGSRGFTVSHQKVVLEIDFSGTLWGYTEITIVPTSSHLNTIYLNSRQCVISEVTVAGYEADFVHQDPLTNISLSNPANPRTHPELKRKWYSSLTEAEDGELAIAVPRQARPKALLSGNGDSQHSILLNTSEFSPMVVHIAYSLHSPADGFQFVLPTDAYPYRVPHAYTSPTCPDAARCWVPCLDSFFDKCTWEFEFVVPKYLEEHDQDIGEDLPDAIATVVVCSGDLVEQIAHPYNSYKTIFLYSQAVLSSVQNISFAAGPFLSQIIASEGNSMEDAVGGAQTLMHAFCLPGHEGFLRPSVSFLRSAMNFYATEFGSYPFGSYKLVFVDELPAQRFDTATMSLVSFKLLHGEDVIEQVVETRHALSHALACQWIGVNIQPKVWSDTWLINGLGLYITGLFLRKLLGNNEYRYRLKSDVNRVVTMDDGSMPPLCQPGHLAPPDPSVINFINLKAPVVIHVLDRRMGKSGTSLGLSRVLPKIFLSAISGDMQNNGLSTHTFLKICRKVSGVDLRSFAAQWIYGSGCPVFGFSASFNRKRMAVEITMRQEVPAFKALENDDVMRALLNPVELFEGQMTIRIHEADGTPYEHVIDIRGSYKKFEVPFNTKYKRVRRNTKRYIARQAAAQAAAEGDTEAAEAMGLVDMAFGLEVWERVQERENWKVADWTEEDEQTMNGATYEWIRMDADFEWIGHVGFEQPDFMWVSQLQRDRDVVAQLEAIHALARHPTAIASSTFTRTVLVSNYYYRIRCEAALALVTCAIRKVEFLGLFHLFKLFLRYCYNAESPTQDLFTHTYVPKPNDFSDLPEYFVRLALIDAISQVRFENGKSPTLVRQFFIDQLRYNDNTANPYSDATYICALIAASACATVSTAPPERGELLQYEPDTEQDAEDADLLQRSKAEVERYRSMDRLIPSAHNLVTVAALEFHVLVMLAGLVPVHGRLFFPLTREGNHDSVRMAAFDGLFLTRWFPAPIMQYILAVVAHDPSRAVRRHVARNACHSLMLLASVGEMKAPAKENEALLIEEDGSKPEQTKEATKTELEILLRTTRRDKEAGKNDAARDFLMPVALLPDLDYEVRWSLLRLADILFRPEKEEPPTYTIRLPATPIIEQPIPPLVIRPKINNSASSLTLGTPSALVTPKIKLFPQSTHKTRPSTVLSNTTPRTKSKPQVKVSKPVIRNTPTPTNNSQSLSIGRVGRMSTNDLRGCRVALKRLRSEKRASIFLRPVDPVRDGAPDYFQVISHPMDLSTMGAKLEGGAYSDRTEFEADFRLMIANCKQYNATGSPAYDEAEALEARFAKHWHLIVETLNKHQVAPEASQVSSMTPAFADPAKNSADEKLGPVVARTGIKLKLGRSIVNGSAAESSELSAMKSSDTPPPPYIDDGSHDLLQEVIAIEQENTDRQRLATDHFSKRRKISSLDDVYPGPESEDEQETFETPDIYQTVAPVVEHAPDIEAQTPSISVKGKDKASPAMPILPKSKQIDSDILIEDKKCKEILKNLLKVPGAMIFSTPVDPVRDGCPTYFNEISHPMDFGTISQKLGSNKYVTMGDFAQDVMLVFANCRQFNTAGDPVSTVADLVERVFKKEWSKATEKKLSSIEKRGLQSLLSSFCKDPLSFIFRLPVDPILLGIPDYFDVIPKKSARDLSLVRQKLDADKYDSVDAFRADLELMTDNAIKFNGPESEVGILAKQVAVRLSDMLENAQMSWAKKRKDGDAMNGILQPKKRVKLSFQ